MSDSSSSSEEELSLAELSRRHAARAAAPKPEGQGAAAGACGELVLLSDIARKRAREQQPAAAGGDDSDDDVPLAQLAKQHRKRMALKVEPATGRAAAAQAKRKLADGDAVDDDDDDDDDDHHKVRSPKRRKKTQAKAKANARKPKPKPKPKKDEKKPPRAKKVEPIVPELPEGINRWWENEKRLAPGQKWETLRHNGPYFEPPYQPHGIKMRYNGQPVDLTPEAEEVATMYAATMHTELNSKPRYIENFMRDWRKILGPGHVIRDFARCDFAPIKAHLEAKREAAKTASKEDREKAKQERLALAEAWGFCVMDGARERIANWRIEPPGLFRGRGDHPKMGTLKTRIQPEDVVINVGHGAPVPPAPPGHNWKKVVHDNTVTWLAHWKENVLGSCKYVMLASTSRLKQESDRAKFETARELKNHIERIRAAVQRDLRSGQMVERQLATAVLALRVGGEKDEDEADTVGCCSLRLEHLRIEKPNIIHFDFLGKDSIRYQNTVTVDGIVFKNFRLFSLKKKGSDQLFDRIDPSTLNKHLQSFMPKLTAKVFRTYNASITLQNELAKCDPKATMPEKILFYNRANRDIAILCNHQKSVAPGHVKQMESMASKIEELQAQLRAVRKDLKEARAEAERAQTAKAKRLVETLKNRQARLKERIANHDTKMKVKDDLKTVSLGTSKINYLDPRITAAWCKHMQVPISRFFAKTLCEKFPWAWDVPVDFRF